MLPLTLLKSAEAEEILIELKNGDTYNGKLVTCNIFMNLTLRDVICTSRNGDKFWKMPECFIRGNAIKYLRIPDEVLETLATKEVEQRKNYSGRGRGRGRGDGNYRGRGGGRGRDGEGHRGGRGGGRG